MSYSLQNNNGANTMTKRTPSGGDGQDWSAYYAAQVNEKKHIPSILHEICKEVVEPERVMGRIPFPLRDMTFCAVYKVYSTRSARRFVDDLNEIQAKGLIERVPSPNSISEYLRNESLTKILKDLISKSSLPLAELEKIFAADSTGLGLPKRRDYYNRHKGEHQRRRDYMKLHVMCGVRSNIITCAEVSEGKANDHPYLRGLIEGTARYFEITEVLADGGYPSGENMLTVLLAGAIPYIAFAKNHALDADYKSAIWKDLLYLYKTRHPQFTDHYYQRNNDEATISALKAKFGGRLRSKSKRGQFNEALCKVLCHNLCVLIHSMYRHGIDPMSWSNVKLRPEAKTGLTGAGLKNREQDFANIRIAAAARLSHTAQETSEKAQPAKKSKGKSSNLTLPFEPIAST
jgi:hypothetical protein